MNTKHGFFLLVLIFFCAAFSIINAKAFPSNAKAVIQTHNESDKQYTIKRNESLWELAGRRDIYNNPFAWPVVYKANKRIITNPYSILDGLTIKIPILLPKEKIKYDNIRDKYYRTAFITSFNELTKKSKQFLIVISKDWDSTIAQFSYYEKGKNKLQKKTTNIPVNLGRAGLGWGKGLIEFNKSDGPVKHEGDGRSPAGIFKLSYAFGFLPKDSLGWLNFPYKQVTNRIECVDDTTSKYYNTLVDVDQISKTWKSSEIMQGEHMLYKFGIFVDHNSDPQISGCGSCIFIHIWKSLGKPTSGCTSMSEEQIKKLLEWLSAEKNPVLIQLPQREYDKIKSLLDLQD